MEVLERRHLGSLVFLRVTHGSEVLAPLFELVTCRLFQLFLGVYSGLDVLSASFGGFRLEYSWLIFWPKFLVIEAVYQVCVIELSSNR